MAEGSRRRKPSLQSSPPCCQEVQDLSQQALAIESDIQQGSVALHPSAGVQEMDRAEAAPPRPQNTTTASAARGWSFTKQRLRQCSTEDPPNACSSPSTKPKRPIARASIPLVSLLVLLLVTLLILSPAQIQVQAQRPPQAVSRSYPHLASSSLSSLLSLSDPAPYIDHRSPTSFVSRILIPRVAGSPGIAKVRQIILDVFQKDLAASKEHGRSGWHIEEHTVEDQTPMGRLPFTNLVFTKNPRASRRLVLAAHYDSKYFSRGDFLGATDSAAPCAMLVDVAVALDGLMEAKKDEDLTLQLIFFDGEEAFKVWTHTDSTYGSRALATNWSQTYFTPQSPSSSNPSRRRIMSIPHSPVRKIDSIEHFVLLDLLGAKEPEVPSYFASTDWLYKELVEGEKRLNEGGVLIPRNEGAGELTGERGENGGVVEGRKRGNLKSFFPGGPVLTYGGIEDDHLPFLANGVPILHLIPRPFPHVWHTLKDDASALDYPTTHAWTMLMRLFVAEYLELDLSVHSSSNKRESPGEEGEEEEEVGWGDDSWLREERRKRERERDELVSCRSSSISPRPGEDWD